MIRMDPVHPTRSESFTPEDITAAHNQGNFDAIPVKLSDFRGNPPNDAGVDGITAIPHKRLTAQLEQDTTITEFTGYITVYNHCRTIRFVMIRTLPGPSLPPQNY